MKSRILIISILLLIFCKFGFSQRIVVERVNFSNIPIVNNEVQVNYDSQTVLKVGFLLARPVQEPWGSLPIKGEIKVFYYKNNQEVNIIDVVTFNKSNWDNSVYSNFIERDVFLPAYSVTLTNPKIQVLTQWRYYKEGYPDPENTNGWTDWYNAGSITFALNPDRIPPTTFSGPNSICTESIYTLTNPYNVTLENASGIATLTALGNNQWKVTRIGSGNGKVTLRSITYGRTFDKDIAVGTPSPTISGTSQINTVGEYDYIVSRNSPGSTIEYNLMLGGDVELIPVSDTQFKIKVVNPNTSGSTMIVKVRARETSSCGTSSYTIKNINLNGNM